jgi:hypothetical protein
MEGSLRRALNLARRMLSALDMETAQASPPERMFSTGCCPRFEAKGQKLDKIYFGYTNDRAGRA